MAAHVDCASLPIRGTVSNSHEGSRSSLAWLPCPGGSGSYLYVTSSFLEGFLAVGTRQVNLPGFVVLQDQDLAKWHC